MQRSATATLMHTLSAHRRSEISPTRRRQIAIALSMARRGRSRRFGDHRHELANSAPFVGDLRIEGMSDETRVATCACSIVRSCGSTVLRQRAIARTFSRAPTTGCGRCQLARAQFPLRCPRHVARWWRLIRTVQWLLPGHSTDRSGSIAPVRFRSVRTFDRVFTRVDACNH